MATKVTSSLIDYTSSSFTNNFRNRVINGNFDIWQRSTTLGSASGDRFSADRFSTRSKNSTYTAAQIALPLGELPGTTKYYHRNSVTAASGAGDYCFLTHRIENVRTFAGKQATLSFYAKTPNATINLAVEVVQNFGSGTEEAQVNTHINKFALTSSWQKFTATVSVPSIVNKIPGTHSSFLGLNFWFDAGSDFSGRTNNLGHQSGTFDITQIQFEEGPVATPFEERFTGTEEILCHRYYQEETDRIHFFPAGNLAEATHDIRITPMRLNPTTSVAILTSTNFNLNTYSLTSVSTEKLRFTGDHNGTGTSGFVSYTWSANAEL